MLFSSFTSNPLIISPFFPASDDGIINLPSDEVHGISQTKCSHHPEAVAFVVEQAGKSVQHSLLQNRG